MNLKEGRRELCQQEFGSLPQHCHFLQSQDGTQLSSIFGACALGHAEVVALLLNAGAVDNDFDVQKMMTIAAQQGFIDVLQVLLRSGAKLDMIDDDGNTLLHVAVDSKQISVVRYLIDLGVDTSKKNLNGKTSLDVARDKGLADIAKTILEANE